MSKSFTAGDKQPAASAGKPGKAGRQQRPERPGRAQPPPQASIEAPLTVRRAVRFMQAGAIGGALSLLFNVIGSFSLKSNMMTANAAKLKDHQVTASQISSTATALIVYTIIVGLVSIGLWLWMARMNAAGRNWARITASVLFALWSLYTYSVIGELHGGVTITATLVISMVLIIALWVVGVATIFQLWRPSSTAYYKAVKEESR
jgi:uncharacterized membrane protein (DUF2068 family)